MRPIDGDALEEAFYQKMKELLKSTDTPQISNEALSLLCGASLITKAPTIEPDIERINNSVDEYISRKSVTVGLDYIINELNKLITDDSPDDGYTDIKNQVEEIKRGVLKLPPEDVQPVVHGKWEEDHWCGEKARRCSVCHITQTVNVYKGKVMYQYCPYCGADMRGKNNGKTT